MEDSAAPQADQVLDSSSEAENSQESFNPGVQMKVEPDYNGSDQSSSADSETSSPLPPVHFGIMSPQEGNASPLTDQSESVEQAKPQKLNCAGNKSAQSHGGKGEKKTISVQNIVEGLRRKSETRMALSGSSGARSSCHKSKTSLDGILEKHEPAFPTSGQNSVFPISHQLQARISTNRDSNRAKQHIVRPNSPTRTCDSLLTDKTHFTYAIMESSVDEEAAKIFNVQNHELVCAIGSKSLVSDKTNRVVASLDFGYFWCNFCPYTTNNKDGLIQHVLEHRFGCKYCPYESFCRSDTVRHMHKMHSEFGESASQLVYCTLLSDYMRIKAHACGQIGKDPDEDVYDPDPNEIESLASEHLSRKRKLGDSHPSDIKSIRLSMESPSATPSWSDSESSFKEKGKSRKNQNPRKHAPPNKTDYDVFSVEVEEVKNQQDPTNETACTENTLQPSEQNLSEAESETLPPGTMQVLPTVTDGSMETYTSKPAGSKLVSLPPKANLLNRGRSNTGTSGSTSTLYWSCGYCSFQSNSQAEIKEHSNKVHPGKPHRYVALIRNMLAEAGIPTKSQSQNASTGGYKHTVQKPALSSIPTNGAQDTLYTHSNPSVSEKVSKRENTIYRCYHCSYTARRHSSLKTHIYHRHRGKGLVAVEEESETGQQMFFCARDDCTFKSDNPGLYLNHVEQCTPWNKPELADVEVEPHIRSCLDQTVAFAETAREKVNNQCLSRQTPSEATEAEKTVDDTGSVVSPGLATTSVGEDTGLADEATLLLERQTGNCWMEESAFKSSHSIACEDQLPGADAQPAQVVSLCNFVFLQSDATENLIVGQASKSGTNTLSSPQMSSRVTQSVEKPLTPSVVLDAQATDHSNDSPSNGLQCSASHSECFIPASVVTSTPLPETTSYSTGKTISVCQEKSTINTSLNSGHGKCETISSEPEHAESKVKQSSGVEKLRPFSSKLKPSTQTKEVESKNASDNSHSVLKKTVGNKNVRPKGSVLVKSCKTAEGGSPCRKENLNNNDLSETKKKYQPADAKWIKDLIDSTSTDNTDSEELTNIPLSMAFTSRMPENVQPRKDENPVIPVGKTEKCCKGDAMDMLGHVSCVSDQARGPEKLNLSSKKPIEMSSECRNEVKSKEKSLAKLYYSCVPARSSAKKAMSKMKSTLVSDVESDEKCSPEKMTMKALPIKGNIEKPRVGIKINMKSLTQSSLHPKTSASNLSGLTSSISSFHAHKRKTTYMCQYCVDVNPGSLRKIKAHVLLKHKSMPPTVVNCRGQRRHKNCQFYVCSQPACFKLFNSEKDLETHKNSCPHEPHVSNTRPKERTTFNSSCCNVANTASFKDHDSVNVKSDVLLMNQPKVPVKSPSAANLPSPVSVPPIRACRVELHMLDASMVEARSLIHKRDGKYQCLYCTDYVYENTLAAMKSHYIQEHEGQLMVMRDTEARRAQQPSRIYVCSSPGCEHSCVSRNDLDNHLRSEHSASSCSYVYQCAVCGWFSSSHAVAIQHVQAQHSPSEGASLVRMQVMVDEQGQTSKKIV